MTDKRNNWLMRTVLFSGLGAFACLLLGQYTDMPVAVSERFTTWWIYLLFIVCFNLLGRFVIRLSTWLNNQYLLNGRRKWRLSASYGVVMLSTLGINYALFVIAKLLASAEYPFTFPNGGMRILILVWLVELVVLGLLSANKSMQDTLRLQKRTAALQEQNNAANYAALQSQLNPHFLFNSLNTLVAEIEYEPQRAVAFTRNLSEVYRYVLQCQDKRLVTLTEELKFAESYLYLHKVRLGDCIEMQVQSMPTTTDILLPPLTLQLLLENVIKHNTISGSRPMVITITTTEDWIVVANTLRPKSSQTSEKIGLKNLSSRCAIALGRQIEVQQRENLFIVKIPLFYE